MKQTFERGYNDSFHNTRIKRLHLNEFRLNEGSHGILTKHNIAPKGIGNTRLAYKELTAKSTPIDTLTQIKPKNLAPQTLSLPSKKPKTKPSKMRILNSSN